MTSLICMHTGTHLSLMIVKKETHMIVTSDIGRHCGLMASAVAILRICSILLQLLSGYIMKFAKQEC